MTTLLWWLLQSTITTTALLVVVAILCLMLRKRPALQHALWLVILVKFVTPPIVIWPWSARELAASLSASENAGLAQQPIHAGFALLHSEFKAASQIDPPNEPQLSLPPPSDESAHSLAIDPSNAENAQRLANSIEALSRQVLHPLDVDAIPPARTDRATGDTVVPSERSDPLLQTVATSARSISERWRSSRLQPVVFGVWFTGMLVTAVSRWRRLARQWRLIRDASEPPRHLAHEIGRLAELMQLRPIRSLVMRGIASPFVWCLGRLRLLWPEQLAGAADVARCRVVIAHELAHVRRCDHWVAWLELLAGAVWWWNPLFWYVRSRLRETAEIACDAMALSVLPDCRRQYAEAFLKLSSIENPWSTPVLGMSSGARRTFERRFTMMLSEKIRYKISMAGSLAVVLLALIALPSWSLGQVPLPGGLGSAPASSDGTAGAATQPAATADSSPNARDDNPSQDPLTDASDEPGDLAKRLEQLNAAGAALETERKQRLKANPALLDTTRFASDLQQAHKDLALMRTGAKIEADKLAHAQAALAQLRAFMLDRKQPSNVVVTEMYLHVLGRRPADSELTGNLTQLDASQDPDKFYDDLVWALLNTKEFLHGKGPALANPSTYSSSEPDTGAGAAAQRTSDSLEKRVQKLEEKLDVVLQELRAMRDLGGSQQARSVGGPGGPPGSSTQPQTTASPDGKVIAAANPDGNISILDNATGKELRRIGIGSKSLGKGNLKVNSLRFSPDGKLLIVDVAEPSAVLEVDAATGQILRILNPQSPTAGELASAGRQLRADSTPAGKQMRVFPLKRVAALDAQTALQAVLPDAEIGADERTNSVLVRGTPEQLHSVGELILKLDSPRATSIPAGDLGAGSDTSGPTTRDSKPGSPIGASTQLDLVSLGTSIVDARGALRLAQAKHGRLTKLGAAVSHEEIESAEINLETAKEKLDLLTRIARSAADSARSEIRLAQAAAEHARKMYEKGYMTQAQFQQAESQVAAAVARLTLIESTVPPTEPAASKNP